MVAMSAGRRYDGRYSVDREHTQLVSAGKYHPAGTPRARNVVHKCLARDENALLVVQHEFASVTFSRLGSEDVLEPVSEAGFYGALSRQQAVERLGRVDPLRL